MWRQVSGHHYFPRTNKKWSKWDPLSMLCLVFPLSTIVSIKNLPVGLGTPKGGLQSSINSSPSLTPPLSGSGRWNFESISERSNQNKHYSLSGTTLSERRARWTYMQFEWRPFLTFRRRCQCCVLYMHTSNPPVQSTVQLVSSRLTARIWWF